MEEFLPRVIDNDVVVTVYSEAILPGLKQSLVL
jgi:hypothetical protein